jgi:hypothetical protein
MRFFGRKNIFVFFFFLYGFLIYSKSIQFGFINFDDTTVLLGRPHLYDAGSLSESLKKIVFEDFPRKGPMILRDISWAIDSHLFGFHNPFGYHLGNAILFSLNLGFLFLFLLQIGWSRFYAAALTLTYGALPLHAEVVCWVMGRKDLLVTFFMVGGLIFQTFYLETRDPAKKRKYYLAGLLATLFALLSKINALTFFAVLACRHGFHSILTGKKAPAEKFAWKHFFVQVVPRYLPHLALSMLVYFWYRGIVAGSGEMTGGAIEFSSLEYLNAWLLFTPLVLGLYLRIIFVPAGHSILYTWPSMHREPLNGAFIVLSILLAILFVGATAWAFFKRKDILFYIFAFFLLMFPYLNIVYTGIWNANRYVHFAAFCLLAVAACLIRTLTQRWGPGGRHLVFGAWAIFLGFNLFQSLQYQEAWKDDRSLWIYETGLKNPSIMSFASLAFSFVEEARNAAKPVEKMRRLEIAEGVIGRGFAYFEKTDFFETEPHFFKLYVVKGIIEEMRGGEISAVYPYFWRAYALRPRDSLVLRKMAELTYKKASRTGEQEKKRELAYQALDFFEKYVNQMRGSHRALQYSRAILYSFQLEFPFLHDRVECLQRSLEVPLNR